VKEHKGKKTVGQQLGPAGTCIEVSEGTSWASPGAALKVSDWFA